MTDKLISRNPEILGGTPVFSGTRVPVRILMVHLEAGDRLDCDTGGRCQVLLNKSVPRRGKADLGFDAPVTVESASAPAIRGQSSAPESRLERHAARPSIMLRSTLLGLSVSVVNPTGNTSYDFRTHQVIQGSR